MEAGVVDPKEAVVLPAAWPGLRAGCRSFCCPVRLQCCLRQLGERLVRGQEVVVLLVWLPKLPERCRRCRSRLWCGYSAWCQFQRSSGRSDSRRTIRSREVMSLAHASLVSELLRCVIAFLPTIVA